jgi:L-2,4-diaminobutyric acid acetyltransferase
MTLSTASALQGRPAAAQFSLRRPRITDGQSVNALVAACPPLDKNSLYLNLLQCTHFAETCVLAERSDTSGTIAGFVSGYLVPSDPTTLFIWQVAIAESARRRGLALLMLNELLRRAVCREVRQVQTTITPSNAGSWALFRALSATRQCAFEQQTMFDRDLHLDGTHESEILVTIGPFAASRI